VCKNRGEEMDNPGRYVGQYHQAADGGNYGIFIVGVLPEKQDFVVLNTLNGEIQYNEEPRRIDYFKASYRYVLKDEQPTERWNFRLVNMRGRLADPGVKIQYAYWLEGRMPHAPIEFRSLPERVKKEFSADENGYIAPSYNWVELARESKGWNTNGLYDIIDITRKIPLVR
jgi:hypothetical protein